MVVVVAVASLFSACISPGRVFDDIRGGWGWEGRGRGGGGPTGLWVLFPDTKGSGGSICMLLGVMPRGDRRGVPDPDLALALLLRVTAGDWERRGAGVLPGAIARSSPPPPAAARRDSVLADADNAFFCLFRTGSREVRFPGVGVCVVCVCVVVAVSPSSSSPAGMISAGISVGVVVVVCAASISISTSIKASGSSIVVGIKFAMVDNNCCDDDSDDDDNNDNDDDDAAPNLLLRSSKFSLTLRSLPPRPRPPRPRPRPRPSPSALPLASNNRVAATGG